MWDAEHVFQTGGFKSFLLYVWLPFYGYEAVVCGSNIKLNIFLLHVSLYLLMSLLFLHCLLMWIKRGTCMDLLSLQSLFYPHCCELFISFARPFSISSGYLNSSAFTTNCFIQFCLWEVLEKTNVSRFSQNIIKTPSETLAQFGMAVGGLHFNVLDEW